MLTRLGRSTVVPGATGVFATTAIKKFTPIEIEPSPDAVSPPLLLNLSAASTSTVSLRRFIALRHMQSSGNCFEVATPNSYFMLAPSSHTSLDDPNGLQEWKQRHHHNYRERTVDTKGDGLDTVPPLPSPSSSFLASPPPRLPSKEEFIEGLESDVADSLIDFERRITGEAAAEEWGGNDVTRSATASRRRSHKRGAARRSKGPTTPLTLPEEHLFHINDGVPWVLPPADDLASPEYWKLHRQRMQIYKEVLDPEKARAMLFGTLVDAPTKESSGEENAAAVLAATTTLLGDKSNYYSRAMLLQSLTRKANVQIDVGEDDMNVLTVRPLVNLREGEELLLHYGWQWWSRHLLSQVFTAVPDDMMKDVRWIEGLVTDPDDPSPQPFPDIVVLPRTRSSSSKHTRRHKKKKLNRGSQGEDSTPSTMTTMWGLFDRSTRARATDEAVLMYSVRRSCIDASFLSFLTRGEENSAAGACVVPPVFDPRLDQDEEVPMAYLRRSLLVSLKPEVRDSLPPMKCKPVRRESQGNRRTPRDEEEEEDESLFVF